MEVIILSLVVIALIALILSIIQISQLALLAVGRPGIGRILFLSMVSLKAWAGTFLLLSLVAYLAPHVLPRAVFMLFNLLLAVYLVAQPIVVNVAVWRWKHEHKHEKERHDTAGN